MRALIALAAAAMLTGCVTSGPPSASNPPGTGSPAAPSSFDPATPSGRSAVPSWPAYHGNGRRSGVSDTMPRVTGQPTVRKTIKLDGQVYASPIVAHGITIVATENDTVYAFNGRFRLLWHEHLGTPSPASERPCGNIDPLGITGTPLYWGRTGLVYVAAEFSGSPPRHQLIALHVKTGEVAWRRHLDLSGVDPAAMQERGALALAGGRIWVPFGGLAGDCGSYKGRVVGYRADGRGHPRAYTVPTEREAGIWTPPGPTTDGHGHLFVAVGNGASGPGDRYDHSDSVLELSTRARLVDSFSPRSWASDNAADLDLGSQGPALVGPWVFAAGKSGVAYVLRRTHLGGIGGQVSAARLCTSFGGTAVAGRTVFVPCTDGVRAVHITTAGKLHFRWHADSSITGSPVVGGGRVGALDPSGGWLYSLGLRSGRTVARVQVGAATRFATPAIAGSNLLVPTESGLTVVGTR
jgi:hypothetical protein